MILVKYYYVITPKTDFGERAVFLMVMTSLCKEVDQRHLRGVIFFFFKEKET